MDDGGGERLSDDLEASGDGEVRKWQAGKQSSSRTSEAPASPRQRAGGGLFDSRNDIGSRSRRRRRRGKTQTLLALAHDAEMTSSYKGWSTQMIRGMAEDLEAMACVSVCPCIVFGRNAKNITDGSMPFFRACSFYALVGGCWAAPLCFVCGPLAYWITFIPCLGAKYRHKLRVKRGLPEIPLSDKQAHCLCHPCALCQESREIASWHSDVVIGPSKPNVDRGPEETIKYLESFQEMKR